MSHQTGAARPVGALKVTRTNCGPYGRNPLAQRLNWTGPMPVGRSPSRVADLPLRPRTAVSWLARGLAVHAVEKVAVLLLDDPSLELETGRELPCLDGQIRWQDREVLDRLPPWQPLVELLDVGGEQVPHLGALDQSLVRHVGEAVLLRPRMDRLRVDRDEGSAVVPLIAVYDHVARIRANRLEEHLDVLRRHVLAARRLDQILLPVGDPQETVVIKFANIAGVQPSVGVERLSRLGGHVVIAAHDARAAQQHLAVFGDPHLGSREARADRSELPMLRAVHERARR